MLWNRSRKGVRVLMLLRLCVSLRMVVVSEEPLTVLEMLEPEILNNVWLRPPFMPFLLSVFKT